MKIGIISEPLNQNLTGIGNYTYKIISELNKINHNGKINIYLINSVHTELFRYMDELIIRNIFNRVLKTYLWYPYAIIKLNREKTDLNLIHNPSQIPTFFKPKQKYVITVHDITPLLFPKEHKSGKSFIYRLLFPRTLKTADKIITVSHNTKQDIINYFKTPDEKIKVIHLAADKKYQPLNKEIISKFKEKYNLDFPFLLYVGTLEPRKNIPTLIKSIYKLKKNNLPHKLVIAGKKGWKYKSIFSLIEELDLQNDVIFTGYVPDVDLPALYNAADMFVYPSLYEGFGLPPLEAMACGCPVITSNTSSLPEVVGDAGIMIDPHDVDELAEAIYEVLTNDGLKANMVEKGLDRAKTFSWERTANETFNLYLDVYNMK